MKKDEIIDQIVNMIALDEVNIVDVMEEIKVKSNLKKVENENSYFKHMYKQFEKIGFSCSYERLKTSIYVLEVISNKVSSPSDFISKISEKTGSKVSVIIPNVFDKHFVLYSGIKYAMKKYLKEVKRKSINRLPEELWKECNEDERFKLYIELEEWLKKY